MELLIKNWWRIVDYGGAKLCKKIKGWRISKRQDGISNVNNIEEALGIQDKQNDVKRREIEMWNQWGIRNVDCRQKKWGINIEEERKNVKWRKIEQENWIKRKID